MSDEALADRAERGQSEPITERRVSGAWQPIETAPTKAAIPVLLIGRYPGGNGWSDIYQCWAQAPHDAGWAVHWARWPHGFQPTHWMPLPPPPSSEEAGQ